MKKILAIVFASVFSLGVLGATGCGDPCEKAFDKMIECTKNEKVKEMMKKKKDDFVKECKKEGDKDKLKECLDKDCDKFQKCLEKAEK
jgi:hypothetical protein